MSTGPESPRGIVSNISAVAFDFNPGTWFPGTVFPYGGGLFGAAGTLSGRLAVLYYRNATSGLMLTASVGFGQHTAWAQGEPRPPYSFSSKLC